MKIAEMVACTEIFFVEMILMLFKLFSNLIAMVEIFQGQLRKSLRYSLHSHGISITVKKVVFQDIQHT